MKFGGPCSLLGQCGMYPRRLNCPPWTGAQRQPEPQPTGQRGREGSRGRLGRLYLCRGGPLLKAPRSGSGPLGGKAGAGTLTPSSHCKLPTRAIGNGKCFLSQP